MIKNKYYSNCRFTVETIREALKVFNDQIDIDTEDKSRLILEVDVDGANWSHESPEEFFADYRRSTGRAIYQESIKKNYFRIQADNKLVSVSVGSPERKQIEAVFEVFEKHLDSSILPSPLDPPPQLPRIFVGHGNSEQWRDVKDHLHDKHDYDVEAYEIGARAGHAIRDILEDMLSKSSFAILVMTGEDKDEQGNLRARQNVIHELGLFQGKIGFSKAIVLLEDGTEEFSNIHGIHQIRYGKNNIKETFGEILATLKREFKETST